MPRIRRDVIFFGIGIIIFWTLWPERFSVNTPLIRPAIETLEQQLEERTKLPPGFSITLYASNLPGARMLHVTETGDLLVSQTRGGRIALIEHSRNSNGNSVAARDLVAGLQQPHGIDVHAGWLYIAETGAVRRVRFNAVKREVEGELQHVVDLPAGGQHYTRSLRFGPDGILYISVGSSCNVCIEDDRRRATLFRLSPDGKTLEPYATGLRNTVGFDWQPHTNVLYGADNGRDFLGDDVPHCELNRLEQNGFYGWPYAHGERIPDPTYGKGNEGQILHSIAPVHLFGAHTAPLGIRFIHGAKLPALYQGAALVALHGSWNRSEKAGYEIVSLHFDDQENISEQKFLTGFELNGNVIGRPVDIAEGPDGSLYVSDDFNGVVYQISYKKPN